MAATPPPSPPPPIDADLGKGFVHLHLHSEYSLLDGGNRVDRLVARVKELGMPAVGVTDHGNIFGAVEFYLAAKEAGIKPILGVEAYVTPPGKPRTDRTYTGGGEGGYHLVLLAENNVGWQNLLVLCSEAFLTGFYYKPRIDRELLAKHSEGLIAINGHLGSEIGDHLLAYERTGDEKHWLLAKESAEWHKAAFGGAEETKRRRDEVPQTEASSASSLRNSVSPSLPPRFYIELQHHVAEQNSINPWLIKLARELDLPLVGDNDAHFLKADDHDAHDTLICISTGKAKSDTQRMRYPTELFVKSPGEMRELFARYDTEHLGYAGREALDNTLRIAQRCNVELALGKSHAPAVRVRRAGHSAFAIGHSPEKSNRAKAALNKATNAESRMPDADQWRDLPRVDDPRFGGDLSAWYAAFCAEFEVVPLTIADDASEADRAALMAESKAECDAALRRLAEAGFVWRYGPEAARHSAFGIGHSPEKSSIAKSANAESPGPNAEHAEKRARLERELKILADKSISAYFLIVWDFVNWGRSHGVPGLARGSGVGTMVGYALGLSNACPVKYGLLFERFTDPDRSEYPDVDIDLCQDGRQRVIEYVRQKYGHVAQIITFGTLKARAAIRDAGRVMEMTPSEVDQVAKLVPETLNITLEEALKESKELRDLYEADERIARVIDNAKAFEGQVRHAGVHAAGVIVATRPLNQIVPLYRQAGSEDHEIVTQWDGPTCEKMGLLKMDFLGLRTISIVERCKRLIREGLTEADVWEAVGRKAEYEETKKRRDEVLKASTHSVSSELRLSVSHPLDLDRLTFADPRVFELFQRGETTGVFQFESPGMRRLLIEMKPDRLEDLIAANALFRPGPMDLIPDYNRRKHGTEEVPKVHDIVDRFTAETYGVMVYQEQVMQIVHGLGGISLRDAYTLIKNISKKKYDKIEKERPKFVQGAQTKGLTKSEAEKLFELILKFAGYGFNKSHSTGYAIVAYQTAYLKTYFPNQYMAAFLTFESQAQKASEWVPYLEDCKRTRFTSGRVGVEVRPPDVNLSQADFAVVFEDASSATEKPEHHTARAHLGHVRFGLSAIKGVSEKAIAAILAERHGAERHEGTEARRHEGESLTSTAAAVPHSVPSCLRASVPFSSLFDFTERILARTPGVLNKTTMEALILSGAMDSLHGKAKRAAMLASVEHVLSAGAKAAADKASGQGALFGGAGAEARRHEGTKGKADADATPLASATAWTESEALAKEKEILGFYVSSHPLEAWKHWAGTFVNASASSLATATQDQRVVMAGIVNAVRNLVIKNGKSAGQRMGVVTLEDVTGPAECVLFADAYAKFGHLAVADAIVFLLGRVDLKRGTPQIMVDRLVPIEGVPLMPGKLFVQVPGLRLNGTGLKAIEQAAGILRGAVPGPFGGVQTPLVAGGPAIPGMTESQLEPKPDVLARIAPGGAGGAPMVGVNAATPVNVPITGVITGDKANIQPLWPVEIVIDTEAGRARMAVDPKIRIRLLPDMVKQLTSVLGSGTVRVIGQTHEAVEPGKSWKKGGSGGWGKRRDDD